MKPKSSLTEEVLLRLSGFVDVFKLILNPPRSGAELRYSHLYEIRRGLEEEWFKKQVANAFFWLIKGGYLVKERVEGQDHFFLTLKGIEKILKVKVKQKMQKRQRKMKDKYLVVIFDIPEKERSQREFFRNKLKELKFKQLQKSVWIAPTEILKELFAFIKLCKVEPYTRVMFAHRVTPKDL